MSRGDVTTRPNRGQWENVVEGEPENSASYSSRDEAVDLGRQLADDRGAQHFVVDAEPTGVITDEPDDADV